MFKHSEPLELTEVQCAYIAGMVDADGMVSCTNNSSKRFPTPIVIVTNTNLELIQWLKDTIGMGTSYKAKTKPYREGQDRANWNPVHRYQLTGYRAWLLLHAIYPYMIVKKHRAYLALLLPQRGREFQQTCPQHIVNDAIQVGEKLKAENKRGVKRVAA